MVVQHNMNAINAYNRLNANVAGLKKASEKLSSGYRINRAGDDAAGLAVSEKMRSQIKGLNQAIRNSQDGINMIQTFEGAAQETHSILQRMKELATQSANGTYDNPTDRAAMQLEFDQLNDELNQIADTDFNGTIVLNGGKMADGLEAKDGEFNYGDKAAQDAAAAAKAAADAAADKALADSAQDVVGGARYKDSTGAVEAAKTTVVDNANYSTTDANKIWEKLGLDSSEVEQVDVTFAYDGKEWVAVSASNAKKGLELDTTTGKFKLAADATDVKIDVSKEELAALETTKKDGAGDAGNGGFSIKDTTVNAIFNSSETQKYDYLTITFQNKGGKNAVPENIGIKEDSWKKTGTNKVTDLTAKPTITKHDDLVVGEMDANIKDALDKVKAAKFKVAATGEITLDGTITNVGPSKKAVTLVENTTAGGYDVVYDSGDALEQKLFTITKPTLGANNTETFEFQIDFDSYAFIDTDGLTANSVTTAATNKPAQGIFDTAEAEKKSGDVSKADAFSNSKAIMTYAEEIVLQTGARTKDAVNFTFNYNVDGTADMGDLEANLDLSSRTTGLATADLNISNQNDANKAIDQIDKAINKTSMVRATFGAIQNRLEHKITNLTTTSENLTEAESSIRDTDMASEMMNYTKFNILQQAAQSMLAQANQQPQSILQLLG